jgi:predicted nucleic acid-binding protein
LVSDTSVLIDLERCELIAEVFALTAEFVVPDVLFNRELRGPEGAAYIELGLRVEVLTADEVADAQQYQRAQRGLSVPDVFSLALARTRGWTLLTGDGPLRTLAQKVNVECHGVLWLLDLMEAGSTASFRQLHDGLERLAAHPRCRLPPTEVNLRLARYSIDLA